MKKIIFLIMTIPILSSSSCRKNNCDDNVCVEIKRPVQRDLDLFFFKKGSFWVYKDLQTNETDTLKMQGSLEYFETKKIECQEFDAVEPCIAYYSNTYKSNKFEQYFEGNVSGQPIGNNEWIINGGWGYYFKTPIELGTVRTKEYNIIDTNYTYKNHKECIVWTRDSVRIYKPDAIVLKKQIVKRGIGVVYREYYFGKKFELIDYKIIQ
jgi:hypothetical protein